MTDKTFDFIGGGRLFRSWCYVFSGLDAMCGTRSICDPFYGKHFRGNG